MIMYKYQYSVSKNGKFLFRTDMISSVDDPTGVALALITKFPKEEGYKVMENRYDASYRSKEL